MEAGYENHINIRLLKDIFCTNIHTYYCTISLDWLMICLVWILQFIIEYIYNTTMGVYKNIDYILPFLLQLIIIYHERSSK